MSDPMRFRETMRRRPATDSWTACLEKSKSGQWVRYSDFTELQKRFFESNKRIAELESEVARVTDNRDQLLVVINSEFHKRGRIGPIEPDRTMVICPHCTSQFPAISVADQQRESELYTAFENKADQLAALCAVADSTAK